MIRRLRDASGVRTSGEAADAAVRRGMADVLAALDNVIDDEAVLGRIHAQFGESVPGAAPDRGAGTAADEAWARIDVLDSATATATAARARRPAASRRRRATRLVAGTAAALAAGAVALAAIGMPGTPHNGAKEPLLTAAYVAKQVDSALSVAEPGEIARMTVTTTGSAAIPGAATTAEEWSYGDQWRSVTYSSAGHPVYDEGRSGSSGYTLVNYQARVWAHGSGLGTPAAPVPPAPGPRGCGPAVAALSWLFQPRPPGPGLSAGAQPSAVASALRAAISCGTLAQAGRQRVHGTEAIELTTRQDSLISETIWVSPATYLPVRVVVRLPGMAALQRTADITWLRPTAQNLANLTVPIPAGFRPVPRTEAAKIVF
jgi:hypothetical protein